jgi:DNA-binding XRE family transcriptional regulator
MDCGSCAGINRRPLAYRKIAYYTQFCVIESTQEAKMPTAVSQSDLVVWAEPTVLGKAKHLFSPLDADFHAIPRICTVKDLPKARVFILYQASPEPKKDSLHLLECLREVKHELLVLYLAHETSSAAFRWGQVIGRHHIPDVDCASTFRHLKQILRSRNALIESPDPQSSDFDLTGARKRLGMTQEEMATALNVAPRTIQNWERGVGTSQMPKKTQDLRELLDLIDEFVIESEETNWLDTPLSAVRGKTPRQAIAEGKMRDLIVEFLRLREGQPV